MSRGGQQANVVRRVALGVVVGLLLVWFGFLRSALQPPSAAAAGPAEPARPLVETVALPCPTAEALLAAGHAKAALPAPLVPKAARSDSMRLVFVAGIEGTGHHAVCKWLERWSPLAAADADRFARDVGQWFFTKSLGDHEAARSKVQAHFRKLVGLAAANGSPNGQSVAVISPCSYTTGLVKSGGGPGMMSYPNFAGQNRMVNQPNLRALAAAAEAAGVDLRVVVLLRAPLASIASTAVHQHTGYKTADRSRLPMQVKTLAYALSSLDFQVRTLDPQFYAVSSYEELVMGEAANILPLAAHIGLEPGEALAHWEATRKRSSTDWTAELTAAERVFIAEHFAQFRVSALFAGREGLLDGV